MNHTTTTTDTPPAPPVKLGRVVWVIALLILIGLAVGFVPRWLARRHLAAETRTDDIAIVTVLSATPSLADFGPPLPADVRPWVQAPIYARASGYLQNWYTDIGQHVTNGQMLATIDTPELDEQLAQAKAELDQNIAALNLSQITADRWLTLLKTASVSEQETAEKTADLALKQAMVAAARANLKRLQDLKGYDLVTAPFDGYITRRDTDIGQLVTAGSGHELFELSQTDPLRVYVRVPQTLIHTVAPGQTGNITFQDLPGRQFPATVVRNAGAVDEASRTLQVELELPNPKGEIFAGSYAQVSFNDSAAPTVLRISDNVLITRAQGVQVAVVDREGKARLRNVVLGRDFGNYIEILSGLTAADRVINNPPDAITDGTPVQVAPAPTTASAK